MKILKHITIILSLLSVLANGAAPSPIIFKENKGQWPEKVLFGAEYLNAKFYVKKNSFNYCVYNAEEMIRSLGKNHEARNTTVHGHNYEVEFMNASFQNFVKKEQQPEYYNYFLGKDRNRWASYVKAFGAVEFNSVYRNIDLKLYSVNTSIKYDLVVKPGGDIKQITLRYKYVNGLTIKDGDLVIKTSGGEITEKAPYAYQLINGKKKEIKCLYSLKKNDLGFVLPDGYDKNYDLIIDPAVIVCSYSGASNYVAADAATYDAAGNIYISAESYIGYPTTSGAFQTNSNTVPGTSDIVISKYDPSGSNKLFATYIGGNNGFDFAADICVKNNEIIIMGGSDSDDFPCTPNAFDTTLNSPPQMYLDIIALKLNITGSALIGSTYVGGIGTESMNFFANSSWGWSAGEMQVDNNGNLYIIGSTNSSNFPTTPGVFSNTLKGTTDAVVLKMNPGLSQMLWSTFLGGTGNESGMSLRLDGNGGVYCFGSTNSINFPVTSGAYNTMKNGSGVTIDLYVSHIDPAGSSLISSTYLGTTSQDYAYLMDIDGDGDVYLAGNVSDPASLMPFPSGIYSNPNGTNFIYKIDGGLSNLIYKTRFGNTISQVNPNLSFTALKVDSCKQIYMAGFGANSFPTTPNAFQSFGGGVTDIYIAAFSQNCSSLLFASYFGGANVNNWSTLSSFNCGECSGIAHFDDRGYLYSGIAVPGGLPTTPNAYATTWTNTSTLVTCNDAFLKVDMGTFVNANSSYGPSITGCPPFTASFASSSNTGSIYWNLGDGTTTTFDTITHTYQNLGTYNVLLVVTDTNTCNRYDSVKSVLNVINPTVFDLGDDFSTCIATPILIQPDVSAVTYSWSSGQTTPTINALPGSYTLTINNGGCNSSDDVIVKVDEKKLSERFPNVVTANGDGVNDFIELKKYNFQEVELIIYDRWGREVFRTNDPVSEWHPDDLKAGTYYYVASYLSSCIGKHATDKGFITIFR